MEYSANESNDSNDSDIEVVEVCEIICNPKSKKQSSSLHKYHKCLKTRPLKILYYKICNGWGKTS